MRFYAYKQTRMERTKNYQAAKKTPNRISILLLWKLESTQEDHVYQMLNSKAHIRKNSTEYTPIQQ